ncbi:MAG: N-acetyl sugar amidotransferase [Syntrophaceae bacterium]|nr:N-acetyl sugar amidotransferase [Syntrophaceae bacterium]
MERPYQICTHCIMDTSDPEISFDGQGRCNHCRNYEVRVASEVFPGEEGKRRIAEMAERIRAQGHGRDYDCIIGVSGGVDSTMVAYTVRKLGLRPLAVHFDNGWNSELAVDNIKKTLDRLGIDLQTHVVDWEEFRDLQLSFLKASVANCEIPTDHAITALLFNTAAQHGIRYIFGGGNVATEGILPFSWGYYNQDRKHLEAVHRRFGTVPLKTTPRLSLSRFIYLVFVRGIRLIPILNYVDYNKAEAMKLIQEELCWRYYGGKHYESIFTRFFQGYILPVKFGFDKRRAHLSTLVCSGEMSREDALREMEKDPYGNESLLREDREFVIKKFGLTEETFEGLMHLPIRSYRDYPNHSFFLHTLRDLRSRFKKVATAA